jgi:hypothetical protein
VGPSSRPLRYVSRPLPPTPPPPPPPPPPQQQGEAGDAHAAAPLVQQFDSEKLPQTLVSEIRPFLRAANAIENENPRVAYLCKFCSRAITPCFLCLPFVLPFSPWSLEEASSQLLCRRPARATPVRGNARQGSCRPHPGARRGGYGLPTSALHTSTSWNHDFGCLGLVTRPNACTFVWL